MAISKAQKELIAVTAAGFALAWVAPKIPVIDRSHLVTGAALYIAGYYVSQRGYGQKLLAG